MYEKVIEEFLEEYKGKLIREDAEELVKKGIDLSDLVDINESELAKILRENVGRERRRKWSYYPKNKEKKKIRRYLVGELKKRPDITPVLFNALFGVGFNSYFSSWNELREKAGLKLREFNGRKYNYMKGRELLINYALDEIKKGRRITQKGIREKLGVHYESYGFSSMREIKRVALEYIVYKMMVKNLNISLRQLSLLTGYSKGTIKKYVNLSLLRTFAEVGAKQIMYISPNKVEFGYKRR